MQLWPAIDLIDGKCVRLLQGDYSQKTEYEYSLEDLAKTFSSFAHGIHLVDLDGAKAGCVQNQKAIQTVLQHASVPVELGGGIRSIAEIENVLSWGISRVIIGTKAVESKDFVAQALQQFGAEKIVLGVDAKDGYVATHGWETRSSLRSEQCIADLAVLGVKTIIYTDISTDGTLRGPAIETVTRLITTFPHIDFIASGGIGNIDDVYDLQKIQITGCIFGKAWYEGKITKQELVNNY